MPPMHDAMTEPGDAQVPDQIAKTRADSITLVLKETTVNSKSDIPTRTFELSSDNKKIVIGRSSKTISKGLVPAANNGYFDSPVVSREHAMLEADLEEGVVCLTDATSLHGTSVNGNRLRAGVPFTLSNGDKLRFGAHVARALDIFHPTECQIEIVCHQQETAPVVERARSYCAPDSADDTSDSDSSDEYDSQTDEPSPKSGDGESLMECDSPTQSGDIKLLAEKIDAVPMISLTHALLVDDGIDDDDDDEDSYKYDSDGTSVESDEEIGEMSNEDEAENEDEDDEEGEEDYGEEDEDGSEDADDNELNSDLQDMINDGVAKALGEDADDDGGAFLEQEIRQFMEKANQQGYMLDKKMQAFAAKVSQEPEVSRDESAPEPIAVPPVSHQEEAHDAVMEDALDANSNTHPFTFVTATATGAGNKKIDIPSILNPSPSSSLLSGADASLNESIRSMPMPISFAYANDANTAEVKATSASTSAYRSHLQAFNQLESLSYAAEEAAVWQVPAFVAHVPAVKATPAPVAVVAPVTPVTPVTPKEAVSDPTPAKSATKRKIDDVAAEDAQILAPSTPAPALTQAPERTAIAQAMPPTMLTPPAEDGPAPKRQATSLAVAARSETRSKAWAAAEKIGIAALGGAVVLGSLIYTAPTF